MRVLTLIAVAVIGSATAISAQEAPELPEGVTESMVSAGETLYRSVGLCFACHGPTGAGVPGAGVNLADDEWLHSDGSFGALVELILSGVGPDQTESGVIMLPRGGSQITDEQARAIAGYVWTLRAKEEA